MKIYNRIAALLLCSLVCMASQARDYVVTSPDGHLKATVSDNERIEWAITRDDVTVLAPSAISIRTTTGTWGVKTRVQKARDLTIDLSKFLTAEVAMDSFADGINAQREATDYKYASRKVSPSEKLNIHLAPAGGWTAIFY